MTVVEATGGGRERRGREGVSLKERGQPRYPFG